MYVWKEVQPWNAVPVCILTRLHYNAKLSIDFVTGVLLMDDYEHQVS